MKLVALSVLITAAASTAYASNTLHQPQQSTPILPGPTTLAVHSKATGQARREKAPLGITWDIDAKRDAFDDGPLPGENSGGP